MFSLVSLVLGWLALLRWWEVFCRSAYYTHYIPHLLYPVPTCQSCHFQAALSIIGIITGPLLGLFLLGMFFRTANSKVSNSKRTTYDILFIFYQQACTFTRYVTYVASHCLLILTGQGGVAGLLTGFIITVWVGVGAQIYPQTADKTNLLPLSTINCKNTTGDGYNTTAPPWIHPSPLIQEPMWVLQSYPTEQHKIPFSTQTIYVSNNKIIKIYSKQLSYGRWVACHCKWQMKQMK